MLSAHSLVALVTCYSLLHGAAARNKTEVLEELEDAAVRRSSLSQVGRRSSNAPFSSPESRSTWPWPSPSGWSSTSQITPLRCAEGSMQPMWHGSWVMGVKRPPCTFFYPHMATSTLIPCLIPSPPCTYVATPATHQSSCMSYVLSVAAQMAKY